MPDDEFSMVLEIDDDRLSIACSGDLDAVRAERLREAFETGIGSRPRRVGIDCRGITFLASAAITTLVDVAIRCREMDVELDLKLSRHARRILDLVGLWWLGIVRDGVAVHESLQRALRVYAEEAYSGNLGRPEEVAPPETAN